MARTFASGDKIVYSGVPPVAGLGALSIVARYSGTGTISYGSLLQITDAGELYEVGLIRDVANAVFLFIVRNNSNETSKFPFAFDGVLRSVVATYDGSRTPKVIVYVDGVSQTITGQPANTVTGSGQTQFNIGRSSPYSHTGVVAEMAVYNRVITPEEALIHTAGYSCLHFPRGLISYVPMIRDVQDIVSGFTGTITGTTVTDHPRIYV